MQEEVTQKTIALSMKTGKLTAQALQAALKKYLQHRAKGPKLHHGKQSLKQLKAHGAALTNIEVTEANIGAFKPCAKKYGVDFTLRKDKTTQPPHYIVIFKAKDRPCRGSSGVYLCLSMRVGGISRRCAGKPLAGSAPFSGHHHCNKGGFL